MNRKLIELSGAYHALNKVLAMIRLAERDACAWEKLVELVMDRMSELSREIVAAPATCAEEVACKASVALDWLNDSTPELADELATSVCRDLMRLFPGAGGNATCEGEAGKDRTDRTSLGATIG